MDYSKMLSRVMRAAALDVNLYEEVEADRSLTNEALIVVIIVSVLSGIGAFLGGLLSLHVGAAFGGLIFAVIAGVVGYYIWAYLTYWIGTSFMGGTADVGELLRTLGYASGPQALGVLSFLPCIGWAVGLAGGIWALVAGVVAVRQALDLDTTKAIITVVIGWLVVLVISIILSLFFGIGSFAFSAMTGQLQ